MRDEYLPKSEYGSPINGIEIKKILVERIFCEQLNSSSLSDFLEHNMENTISWLFKVGVYKSKEKYYLLLDLNDYNTTVNSMIEEGCCPNTGFICISKEEAEGLIIKISELGKEYFLNTFSNFQEVINILCSAISCEVYFENRLNEGGLVSTETNGVRRIYIANNQSQLVMLFSLLHEFAHFQLNSRRIPPTKNWEYIIDEEECWCNSAALILAWDIIKDVIAKVSTNLYSEHKDFQIDLIQLRLSIEKYINYNKKEKDIFFAKIKEEIFSVYRKLEENGIYCQDIEMLCGTVLFLDDKNDELICEMGKKIILQINQSHNVDFKYDCKQSGLVVLSSDDNKKLYEIIINEISPMMPNEG